MKILKEEIIFFIHSKLYMISTFVVLLLTYGSMLINPTIGIDDTAWKVYFIDGVSPIMGRWVLFVINKILPIAEYNPYFVELFCMLWMLIAATLWTICVKRILSNQIPLWGYTIFACVFISSPITSDVITYYLSNGLAIGFSFTALALWNWMNALERQGYKSLKSLLFSILLLCVALGCFESMMIVFLVSCCFFFLIRRGTDVDTEVSFGKYLFLTALVPPIAMFIRSICIQLVIIIFSLQSQIGAMGYRGFNELFPWITLENPLAEVISIIQEFIAKFYINGIVYKPIMIFVIAMISIGVYALYKTMKQKDILILLSYIGIIAVPILMAIIEGYATFYRASQFVVVINAFLVIVILLFVGNKIEKTKYKQILIVLACLLLYHQIHEMNLWLKQDQDKYADVERTLSMVAVDIIKHTDENLPICVVGEYEVPNALTEMCYMQDWSKKTKLAIALLNLLDESLVNKYMTEKGYSFTETPLLSVVKWGSRAFYGFDRELIKVWNALGYSFTEDGNGEHYAYGESLIELGMPSWPEEGSIIEVDGSYIIVHLGSR